MSGFEAPVSRNERSDVDVVLDLLSTDVTSRYNSLLEQLGAAMIRATRPYVTRATWAAALVVVSASCVSTERSEAHGDVSSVEVDRALAKALAADPAVDTSSTQPAQVAQPYDNDKATEPPALPPLEQGVALAIEPPPPGGPHTIAVATNLPDGTDLMVDVEGKSVRSGGSDKVQVRAGRATAGPFGEGGTLLPGKYAVEVTMPIPAVQSDEVRRIIGEKGEKLRGPLVKRGSLGVTVEKRLTFVLGGDSAGTEADALKLASELLQQVSELEKAARAMQPLRRRTDTESLRKCGELMRRNQPEAERLRAETARLPTALGMHIGIAAGDLVMCSSCLESADRFCTQAAESLKKARSAIRDARR